MATGWLVNDSLTCIPGTRTLWHDLLDWIPGLVNMTGPDYDIIAAATEAAARGAPPDYIIRNASYFRPLDIDSFTICLLQDRHLGAAREMQLAVCRRADVVVVNSRSTLTDYPELRANAEIIPIGVDFTFFRPVKDARMSRIAPRSLLFVGDSSANPKGFDRLWALIRHTPYDFCLVMKDDFATDHPRVTVFNRVDRHLMLAIYNSCAMLVCTSRHETQHLAGIEAAACGLPVVATEVGLYRDLTGRAWGHAGPMAQFPAMIRRVMDDPSRYDPRGAFMELFDRARCMTAWKELIAVDADCRLCTAP